MSSCKLTIGNGFDLFCSLNTKYKDFFDSKDQKRILDAIDAYEKKYFSSEKIVYLGQIEEFDEATTAWDILFYKEPDRSKRKNWCDVEKFIFDFFNYGNDESDSQFYKLYTSVKYNVGNKFDCVFDWHKLVCVYLHLKKAPSDSVDEFSSFLLEELQRFEKKFGKYVYNEFKKNENIYSTFFRYFFKNDLPENVKVVSLDTFNYSPIELCLRNLHYDIETIYSQCKIKHINGDYEKPIFGIDSSRLNVDDAGHIFTKTYRRITSDFYEGVDKNIITDRKFDDLVIFGHSLNEQDYNYYFPLFDYMQLMDVTVSSKIYFLYYIYDESEKNIIKKENVKKLYAILNKYEEYKTGKAKEHRLVDVLSSRGRLRFKKVARPAIL